MDRTNYIAMLRNGLRRAAQAMQGAQGPTGVPVPPELIIPATPMTDDFTAELSAILGKNVLDARIKDKYITPNDLLKLCAHFSAQGHMFDVLKFFRVTVKGASPTKRYATVWFYITPGCVIDDVQFGTCADDAPVFMGLTTTAEYNKKNGIATAADAKIGYTAVVNFGAYNSDTSYGAQFVHAFMCIVLSVRMIEMRVNGWMALEPSTVLDDDLTELSRPTCTAYPAARLPFNAPRTIPELQAAQLVAGQPNQEIMFNKVLRKFTPDGLKLYVDKNGKAGSYTPSKSLVQWLKVEAYNDTDGKFTGGATIKYVRGGQQHISGLATSDMYALFAQGRKNVWPVILVMKYNVALTRGENLACVTAMIVQGAKPAPSTATERGQRDAHVGDMGDDDDSPPAPPAAAPASAGAGARAPPTGVNPDVAAADFGVAFE